MSFSVSEQYCTFRNTPVTPTCTYARIYSWSFRFLFGGLASIDGEAESLMLPGSVAVVLEDTPRNSTHCRNISLLEINKVRKKQHQFYTVQLRTLHKNSKYFFN
jgi:hypothetical protein